MDASVGGILKTVEAAGDVTVERALVGVVNCRDVRLERSAAGPITASGQVSILNGGCGPMIAGGDVSITNGGCGPIVVKGDVSITNGGTQSILAAGDARIGKGAFVGLVAAPKVEVEEGATVLMSIPQALAFGAAFGTVVGLLVRGRRRSH